jgi:hypothetical protein
MYNPDRSTVSLSLQWTHDHEAMYGSLCCCEASWLNELWHLISCSNGFNKRSYLMRSVMFPSDSPFNAMSLRNSCKESEEFNEPSMRSEPFCLQEAQWSQLWRSMCIQDWSTVKSTLCLMCISKFKTRCGSQNNSCELDIEFVQTSEAECPQFTLVQWYQSNN